MAKIEWQVMDGRLRAKVDGKLAAWYPQPGSQTAFMQCPVAEVLLEGNRGGGKTDALLMDFAQYVGQGYGPEWRGIIFRRTFPELSDVTQKAKLWFKQIWPDSDMNVQKMLWQWPTGETLYFRHILRDDDYLDYIGTDYRWIAFEELVTWPTPVNYLAMMACNRSSVAGIPLHYRATTNAYGPGHNWIKKRFRLPIMPGRVVGPTITDSVNKDGHKEPPRLAIRSSLAENKIMLFAQPDYAIKVAASAANAAQRAAWMDDDWNITAGGMFDDIWQDAIHVVPDLPFKLLEEAAKAGWFLNRAYDHGQSKPFSVGWWAQSNGEPIRFADGRLVGSKRGDIIRFNEWYGWNGEDDEGLRLAAGEIAQGIKEREQEMGLWGIIKKGPADSAIFANYDGAKSVAKDMAAKGVYWDDVDKSAGSRHQGWQQIRKLLKAAVPEQGQREAPGLFVCERCEQFRRTVPCLSRADKDPDDVNDKTEDHIGDETRYRTRWTRKGFTNRSW
ncbi:MAG: terminase [Planctomycetaceae bacterium]|nr:MAG: terminase [Planctomycetaceae bacterium]